MKKITITYLSLLLILTSLFSTPISVLANTEAGPEDENAELEVTEEAAEEENEPQENTSEEEPAEEPNTESEEEVTEEEAVEASEEPETETEKETEEEETMEEESVEEQEEADEERYGFSLELAQALNAEGEAFTEEEELDQDDSFTLRLTSILDADQNYQAEDVETVQLPSSVVVAAADQGTVQSNGTDIATYQVHENGEIEFTFLEAIESAGAVNEPVDVEVYINENAVDEEFAYIAPIDAEEQITIPLLVEDEEKQGFSIAVEEALDSEGNAFTEEEGLDSEEAFTLRMESILTDDQNYEAGDVEVATLSSSVEVAEAVEGTIESDGTEIATYVVAADGQIEVTFLEGVESAGAAASPVDVEVLVNENSIDEEFAYVAPIGAEEQLAIPLAVEEETAEEEASEEESDATEEDADEESTEESSETEEGNERSIGTFAAVDENLLSSFEFVINPGPNETVVEDGADLEVDLNDMNAARLIYGITKPDELMIAEGDTYTIDLPSFFEQSVENRPITVDGTEVATYSIVDGQVIITFNENVNDFDDVEMNVDLTGNFNTEVFETEQEVVVEVPFRDGSSYTATLIAEQQDYDGEDRKSAGNPYVLEDGEKVEVDRNPEFIDWTVRVNDSMNSFENAAVIDDLGENLSIEEGSFIIERIIRNYNNEEIGREQVDVTPVIYDGGFELDLGDIEDAYEITYTTSIDRPDGGGTHTINNNARIILDGDENPVSDGFEGTWSGDLPGITKNGSLSNDRQDVIDWTVEYNYGQENIGTVTLTDELSHGEIIEDTIQVFLVETNVDGEVVGTPELINVTPVIDDGNMTIPELDAEGQAYYMTFSSSVPTGLNDTVINTISDDMQNPNADDASVDVNTVPTGGKVGEQYVDEEGNPYIEWTITMNSEKIDVGTIGIIDVFNPEYLDFDVDDNSLYELMRDGEEVDNFNIDGHDHDDGRAGFELSVNDAGPHTYEFVYRTYYTTAGMQQPELANNAELIFEDGDGIGIGDSVGLDFGQTGPNAGIEKSAQYVTSEDDTEQEIEWTVIFNNSKILLENPKITDKFTSGNYEYIEGSLDVTSDGETLDYEEVFSDSGFELQFDGNTNATYTITYRTTADDAANEPQTNEAVLTWQGGDETATAEVAKRDPGIYKNGAVEIDEDGSKTIDWLIGFNENRNVLHDVTVTDVYSPASATVSDITLLRDGAAVDSSEYNVLEPGDGTFVMDIGKLDAVPYQISYKTTLSPAEEAAEVQNLATIDYTGGEQSAHKNIPSPSLGVSKQATNLDKSPEKPVISWQIDANTDSENNYVNLVNPVLRDTIPGDQSLIEDTIVVVRGDGEDVTNQVTINYSEEDEFTFEINLPDGPYQYRVTFDTEILEYPSFHETDLDRYTNSTTLSDDDHGEVSDDAYQDYFDGGESGLVGKSGEQNPETEDIDWTVSVNEEGLTINNPEISDSLSDNQTYVEESITVKDGSDNELDSDAYELNVAEDNKSFTVTFTDNVINEQVNISYSTRLNPDLIGTFDVTNSVSLSGGEEQREIDTSTTTSTAQQWTYGGGGSGRTLDFNLQKLHENGETPVSGATFEFLRVTTSGTEVPLDNIVTTDEDGNFHIDNARAGRYIVNETGVPEGYQQLEEPFHVIIGYSTPEEIEAGAGDYNITVTNSNWEPIADSEIASADGNTLTVYNELETGSVSATKDWVSAEESNYPTTWLMLYRNLEGEDPEPVEDAEVKELNSDSSSVEVSWEDLEMNAPDLEPYIFSVKEVDSEGNDYTPAGFTKEEDGLTVTNTATFIDIDVNKEWEDSNDQDGIRPDGIEVQLTENGTPVGETVELNDDNNWAHTFEDLREVSSGEPVEYNVEEVNVPEGYESSTEISEDGTITITNSHDPETIEVSVSKEWEDADNQDGVRPNNVTVNLLDGSSIVESVVLSEENAWQHTFTDLPVYANGSEIDYSVTENTVANYSTDIVTTNSDEGLNSVVTNTYTPEQTTATVTKAWDDGGNQDGNRPEEVTVQLLADGESHGEPIVLTAGENWTHTWTDLDLNAGGDAIDYTVQEIDAPEGYEVSLNNEDHGNLVITNSYEPEVTDVSVSKAWDDSENQDGVRPDNVTVNLLADGEIERTAVVDADGDWEHTFTNLPVYDNGNEINYTVTENTVEDYSGSIVEENENNFVVTNSHTPDETSVTVTKAWDDANNQDGQRPDNVEVQLTADGEPVGDAESLTAENDWTNTWDGLPANAEGEAINYSVEELNVPEGYTSSINDEDHGNIVVTNSYTPELTEVPVTKVWDDSDNQDGNRPGNITLNLLNDRSEIVRSAVVEEQEGNEWEYTFTDIPMYENGTEINYRVTENFVSDYSTEIEQKEDGVHVVTNSYTPDETSVTVTKGWNDADDQDGERPESIEVQLTAGGEATGDPVTLSEENDWTHTWNELALNSEGEEIAYSVEELDVPEGYTSSINDADHGNIIVANSYTPSLIDIPVEKVWDDEDDQDRVRPGQVIVNLNNGAGELESRVILNDDNDWQHTFTDLPEYANGELINYTITENSVEDYSTNIEEDEDGVRTVTNSYTPEETSVTVVKGWEDGNNQDGNRPESIEVQLLANGDPEGDAVEITAENDWTHTWQELDANEAGEPIEYSVQELNVPEEYEVNLNDENHGNITLTNSYTPETTEISGTKTWDDADDQDGLRSDSITVNLLANGEQVDSGQASEETGWSYSFTDLHVYEAGEEIDYTIEEVAVEGYETSYDGFDITNSHTPATTEVSGTKTWDDADNQDGERPDSITVNLLADGEEVDSAEVTADDEWNYSFTDLPVNEAGEEIVYTVTENTVADYSYNSSDEGYDITNSYTPGETSVTVTKTWDDANNQDGTRSDSIDVQLTADDEEIGDPVTLSDDNNWTNTWSELDEMAEGQAIDYSVIELDVPESYDVEINDEDHGNIIITNSYTPETTEASVSKVWDDNDNQDGNRPNNVTVNLLNDSEIVTEAVLNEDNDWQHTFTDLPVYEDGQEIQYSITENTVAGYSTEIDTTSTDEGLSSVVTNTYTPEETSATVTKVWNDGNNQDGDRPETVDVQLFADGQAHGDPVVLTSAEDWTHTWTGLDLNAEGKAVNYTVQEVDVAEGYTSAVNNNDHGNLVITNTSEPEVTEVNVSKAWEDEENQDDIRPDNVTINLLADGEIERTAVVDADGDWEHTFTNLPVNDNGNEINYTVTENTVENYSASIVEESDNSFVVTNTYTPEETSVTAVKAWDDSNNQDNVRTESVEVQLTADGKEIGEPVTLSTENDWTNTWNGLPLNNDGEPINYSVEELDVPEGYTASINDEDHGNIIITNSYTPETIDVPVAKVWDDNDNQDGVRPNNVTVNLVDDEGKVIEQVILSEDNEWQYTFTDLPVNASGEAINYTVTENAVTDYSTSIAQNDDGVNVITNTYTPGETSVTVTKGWKDKKNKDARPDSIEVQLTADGEEAGKAVTLSAENNWTHTWDGLAENNDGTAIEYSVEELNIPEGYKAFVKDDNHGNIIVINSYTTEDDETPEPGKDPEAPSEGKDPEDPKDEGTPGTEDEDGKPTDSTDKGTSEGDEGDGASEGSKDGSTSGTEEGGEGTPRTSTDEGTPGSGEGTPETGEEEGSSEGSLPVTGIALGSTIAILAVVLFAAGAALLFFARRRS
ncbi:Cna B-type domain-containing protein [Salinicoccus sp. Marseille-QA3877]